MNTSLLTLGLITVLLTGCAASPHARVIEDASAVELRSYQSRTFASAERIQTLRTVMATLQDLGFVIDKADATLGSVSATRLEGERTRMTVTVRSRSTGLLVRANAETGLRAVEEPVLYQSFFAALDKSMFLALHEVD